MAERQEIRNEMICLAVRDGKTYASLSRKYGISATRVRQIAEREEYRMAHPRSKKTYKDLV
jgi:Mor family transcriptional regulator